MTTNEIIMLCIAAYFAAIALILSTNGLGNAVLLKVVPMFSAVVLTLIAFRII